MIEKQPIDRSWRYSRTVHHQEYHLYNLWDAYFSLPLLCPITKFHVATITLYNTNTERICLIWDGYSSQLEPLYSNRPSLFAKKTDFLARSSNFDFLLHK
jgi:hypothetical protein